MRRSIRKLSRGFDDLFSRFVDTRLYDVSDAFIEKVKDVRWRRGLRYGRDGLKVLRSWLDLNTWLRSVDDVRKQIARMPHDWRWKYRRQLLRRRLWAGIKTYYDPIDEKFRQTDELTRIFEVAGVEVSEFGNDTNTVALSSWGKNGPKILLHPSLKLESSYYLNWTLFHEMFHLVSATGLGLCHDLNDPKEVLANLFAYEMTNPLPVVAKTATSYSDFRTAQGSFRHLMRITNRQAFEIALPLEPRGRALTFQLPSGFVDTMVLDPWHAILAWAPDNLIRRRFREGCSVPTYLNDPKLGTLHYLTEDGLLLDAGSDGDIWRAMEASGMLDNFRLGPGQPEYRFTTIPEINEGELTVRGGNHLVVSEFAQVKVSPIEKGFPAQLFYVVEDGDGALMQSWEHASSQGMRGPLLLDTDSLSYAWPMNFEDWVRSMEEKFFGTIPGNASKHRRKVEPILKNISDDFDSISVEIKLNVLEAVLKEEREGLRGVDARTNISLELHVFRLVAEIARDKLFTKNYWENKQIKNKYKNVWRQDIKAVLIMHIESITKDIMDYVRDQDRTDNWNSSAY